MAASSLETIINYATAGNFSFDADLIEISGGAARLKLQEDQEIFAQDFNSDSGFTYDSALVEFAAGVVRQSDQRPANSLFGSKFTTTRDSNWINPGTTVLTATDTGTPTLVGGYLVCAGGNNGITYTNSILGNVNSTGSIKFKLRPSYSGTPGTNQGIIAFENPATPGTGADYFLLLHSASGGTWRATARNSANVSVYTAAQISGTPWSPTAGQTYEIELVLDTAGAGIRLFIDGVLFGTLSASTFTRGTTATKMYIGSNQTYAPALCDFDDVIAFSDIQHTAGYSPGYSLPDNAFLESKVDLPVFTFSGVGSIVSVDSATVSESGSPRYIVAGRFWNGSMWAVSDGTYAQSSPSADVIANLTSYPATGATLVPVSVTFGDTNTQSSVDDFSVTVTGTVDYPTTAPSLIQNSGVLADALEGFEETMVTVPSGDALKHTINFNGQDKYWNGSAWVNSDGTFAQANTAAEIEANKASLDLALGGTLKIRTFLSSGDGLTTPEVETVTVGYNFFSVQADPPTITVYGFYRDISGDPVEGATVSFSLFRTDKQYREAASAIIEKSKSVLTDANGRFEIDLILSSAFETSGGIYEVSIVKSSDSLETSVIQGTTPIRFTTTDDPAMDITDRITEAT